VLKLWSLFEVISSRIISSIVMPSRETLKKLTLTGVTCEDDELPTKTRKLKWPECIPVFLKLHHLTLTAFHLIVQAETSLLHLPPLKEYQLNFASLIQMALKDRNNTWIKWLANFNYPVLNNLGPSWILYDFEEKAPKLKVPSYKVELVS